MTFEPGSTKIVRCCLVHWLLSHAGLGNTFPRLEGVFPACRQTANLPIL